MVSVVQWCQVSVSGYFAPYFHNLWVFLVSELSSRCSPPVGLGSSLSLVLSCYGSDHSVCICGQSYARAVHHRSISMPLLVLVSFLLVGAGVDGQGFYRGFNRYGGYRGYGGARFAGYGGQSNIRRNRISNLVKYVMIF